MFESIMLSRNTSAKLLGPITTCPELPPLLAGALKLVNLRPMQPYAAALDAIKKGSCHMPGSKTIKIIGAPWSSTGAEE